MNLKNDENKGKKRIKGWYILKFMDKIRCWEKFKGNYGGVNV